MRTCNTIYLVCPVYTGFQQQARNLQLAALAGVKKLTKSFEHGKGVEGPVAGPWQPVRQSNQPNCCHRAAALACKLESNGACATRASSRPCHRRPAFFFQARVRICQLESTEDCTLKWRPCLLLEGIEGINPCNSLYLPTSKPCNKWLIMANSGTLLGRRKWRAYRSFQHRASAVCKVDTAPIGDLQTLTTKPPNV